MTTSSTLKYRHVLMDWDGTTSLVRAGWAELMVNLYLEELPRLADENDPGRHRFAWDEVMRLNGRPTIHQAIRLVHLVTERGGKPREATAYLDEFQHRLGAQREIRLSPLRRAPDPADVLLVPGVRPFMETVRARGLKLTLATGTVQPQALEEAELLGLAQHFEGRIFGPMDPNDTTFSKGAVVKKLLRDEDLEGSQLMAFGDGPVEIAETAAVGGYAVGVACDETHPGTLDPWKRDILLAAGAHEVITDYREAPALLERLGV